MSTCLLILLGFCHPTKAQFTLGAMNTTIAVIDAHATVHNFSLPEHKEYNPLARPFVSHGPALTYASVVGESMLTAWLGNKMRHSNNRVLRKISWLPQVVSIGGHTAGAITSIHNRWGNDVQNTTGFGTTGSTAAQPTTLPVLQGGPVVANGS